VEIFKSVFRALDEPGLKNVKKIPIQWSPSTTGASGDGVLLLSQ
jgi:hypothetical protein